MVRSRKGNENTMKRTYRMIAVFMAVLMLVGCSGKVGLSDEACRGPEFQVIHFFVHVLVVEEYVGRR